jgi:hypothetical protein
MPNMKVVRLADRDLQKLLTELHAELVGVEQALRVKVTTLGHSIGAVDFPSQENPAWRNLIQSDTTAIEQLSFSIGGVQVNYWRGGQQDPKSGYTDEFSVSVSDPSEDKVRIGAAIVARLRPIPVSPSSEGDGDRVLAMRAIQEETFARLERLHEEAIRASENYRAELARSFSEKSAELEKDLLARKEVLEQEASKAANLLLEKEAALEARRKTLDDRDNTHARREIRDEILADVKQRIQSFGVSGATESKRTAVVAGIAILAAVLLFGIAITWLELQALNDNRSRTLAAVLGEVATQPRPSDTWERIWLWSRLLVLGAALIATVVYYVKWQNSWAQQHAQLEFALQQFHIDINRANWAIESCLEWRKNTSSPIPTALLESITRGLFEHADAPKKDEPSAADELASALLGSASKLRLKAGDSELEFDKPAKLQRAKRSREE